MERTRNAHVRTGYMGNGYLALLLHCIGMGSQEDWSLGNGINSCCLTLSHLPDISKHLETVIMYTVYYFDEAVQSFAKFEDAWQYIYNYTDNSLGYEVRHD